MGALSALCILCAETRRMVKGTPAPDPGSGTARARESESAMLVTEQILRKMDGLYHEAASHEEDEWIKGELFGLAETLVLAYHIDIDDVRKLMEQRSKAAALGKRIPTMRKAIDARLTTLN